MDNTETKMWIVIDYLGDDNKDLSRYSEHLISNIDASIALGEMPNVATIKLSSKKTPTEYEFCLDETSEAEEKTSPLQEILDEGGIVVCDRLNSILLIGGEEGLELSEVYKNYLQEPNLIIFLDLQDQIESLNEEEKNVRKELLRLQEANPEKIKVITTDGQPHDYVCDTIWETASNLIKH